MAVLTDTVLSGRPGGNAFSRSLLSILPGGTAARVVTLALGWLLLQVTNDVVTLLREMINNRLRYNGTARVRHELFDHLQRLSPAHHRSRPQGDSIYRLGTDTLGFFGVLNTFVGAANSALTLFVIGAVMLGWNVRITVVALCLAPLLVLANVYFGRTIRRTSAASKQADADFTTFVQRAVTSIGLVQLFGRQADESGRFRGVVDRTIRAGMRMNWQEQLYPLAQRVVYALGYGFVLGYGGYLVYRDQQAGVRDGFTVGGIFALTFYLAQLWEPLRRITGFSADVQNNVAACARVFFVLDVTPAVADSPEARPLPVRPRTLELNDVRFEYGDGRPVLRGVDAADSAGPDGRVHWPQRRGQEHAPEPAAAVLRPDRRLARARRPRPARGATGRRAAAHRPGPAGQPGGGRHGRRQHRLRLPARDPRPDPRRGRTGRRRDVHRGTARWVRGRGDGGRPEPLRRPAPAARHRPGLARPTPPILVLDEPTSGLDPRHERQVLRTLHGLKGRRTVILVTHSLAAAAGCDVIFVLQEGKVAESGTHEELTKRGGLYAAMAAAPTRHCAPGDPPTGRRRGGARTGSRSGSRSERRGRAPRSGGHDPAERRAPRDDRSRRRGAASRRDAPSDTPAKNCPRLTDPPAWSPPVTTAHAGKSDWRRARSETGRSLRGEGNGKYPTIPSGNKCHRGTGSAGSARPT